MGSALASQHLFTVARSNLVELLRERRYAASGAVASAARALEDLRFGALLMNRFKSLLLLAGLLPVLMGMAAEARAEFQEGVHFERLPVAIETRDPNKVEVVEVFSYACIHCKNFQPAIDAWHADIAADVDFYRLPAAFDPTWARLAQAYFAAEALGVTDAVHELIFSGIHDRNVNLSDPAQLAILFKDSAGVEPEAFNQVFNSFSVRSRVQQADARTRAYRVTGTPTLIVDGQYRIDVRMGGSNAGMLAVVDYLIERQRALRNANESP
jgi:thiol:disulfide interchange protein DsbA